MAHRSRILASLLDICTRLGILAATPGNLMVTSEHPYIDGIIIFESLTTSAALVLVALAY